MLCFDHTITPSIEKINRLIEKELAVRPQIFFLGKVHDLIGE